MWNFLIIFLLFFISFWRARGEEMGSASFMSATRVKRKGTSHVKCFLHVNKFLRSFLVRSQREFSLMSCRMSSAFPLITARLKYLCRTLKERSNLRARSTAMGNEDEDYKTTPWHLNIYFDFFLLGYLCSETLNKRWERKAASSWGVGERQILRSLLIPRQSVCLAVHVIQKWLHCNALEWTEFEPSSC